MATDHVTGLATRGDFEAWLRARDTLAGVAFVSVDVVGLKRVNGERGFLAGDDLLARAAARLRDAAHGALLVARLGGDEFVAVFRGPAEAEATVRSLAEPAAGPRLRVAATTGTGADTRHTLVDRLYAAVRGS
ncbi:MAG: GGDEF domain-containing protein [Planctomycetia bacterium]|nr:GGDEF domain-containing protein [Planctomycetia bacterium]